MPEPRLVSKRPTFYKSGKREGRRRRAGSAVALWKVPGVKGTFRSRRAALRATR